MRRIATVVMIAASFLLAVPASADGGGTTDTHAARTFDKDYHRVVVDGGWAASLDGYIRFYSRQRKFKVFGDMEVTGPTQWNAGAWDGYVRVQNDVLRTSNDGRPYSVGYSTISNWGRPHLEPTGFDEPYPWVIGENDSGEYFSFPTRAGHGLRGVWIQVCHHVSGPDVCSQRAFIDNPYT